MFRALMRFLYITGILPFISFATIFLLSGCDGVRQTQKEIDAISSEFVPDGRVEICSIRAQKGGNKTMILKGETTSREAKEAIINALYNSGKSFIDSILILPDTVSNKRFMGLATLSVINLRKEPDHTSELVSQALLGTPVLILKERGSWLLIRTPDRYISWTESSSLRKVTREELNEWKLSERMIFIASTGWIFSNPSETGVTGDIVSGSIVSRTGDSKDHYKIILPDGREGFVNRKLLVMLEDFLVNETVTSDHIVDKASELLGVPYLWGGSSPKGMDCSGLVRQVFFLNRLIVGRDASLQALQGDPVDISEGLAGLNKGDLLFFGSESRISHVAIYIGNSEYIHASGRVMINSLDPSRGNFNEYRRNTLVKATRILNSRDESIMPVSRHEWY